MKLVMTLMVRDEVDVISAMLEHHLAQGVDMIIVTDNGSVDGTLEILRSYYSKGRVQLHHDPVHRKQQNSTVTRMAREAYTVYGADWVINADADEFWVTVNPEITLRNALENTSKSIQSFEVPVVDMTGMPALAGSGFSRLIYRDNRLDDAMTAAGLLAHSTPDAVHVGQDDIEVSQGNHFVSLKSLGQPEPEWAMEVLHLPWRSWNQFRQKVENAGRAYEANPELLPSPNHHGMREYRRLLDGALLAFYVLRHPTMDEIELGLHDGSFMIENRVHGLEAYAIPDKLFDPAVEAFHRKYGAILSVAQERQRKSEAERSRVFDEASAALTDHAAQVAELEAEVASLEDLIAQFRARQIIRLADKTAALQKWIRDPKSRRGAQSTSKRRSGPP